ncbi:MAG: hypothetical protein ACI9WT_002189 [Flavobacterium sp.]|jgi:hypothetical protein
MLPTRNSLPNTGPLKLEKDAQMKKELEISKQFIISKLESLI